MKYVYILEDDSKFLSEILEALEKIDPKLTPRVFSNLEQFANWIQLLSKEGVAAIPRGGLDPRASADEGNPAEAGAEGSSGGSGPDQLVAVISSNPILGSKHIPLLRKTQGLFVQKGLCTKEDPTAFVITAFDNPDFDIETVEDRVINNVIFKPFDKMILQQHLIFAIGGRHPPSEYKIHNFKTSAIVEMLKDVDVEAFSEVGFITKSTRPVKVGAVAKYYGDVFKSGNTRSVFARCFRCEPHPDDAKIFRCAFTYFGTEPEQISTFRHSSQDSAQSKTVKEFEYLWRPALPYGDLNVIVIDPDESGSSLAGSLDRSFRNVFATSYKTLGEFKKDLDPNQIKKEKNQPAAFPVTFRFRMIFDPKTHKLLQTDPAVTPEQSVLGIKGDDFNKLDFFHWLPTDERAQLLTMMKGHVAEGDPQSVMLIRSSGFEFFVRLDGHRNLKDAKGNPAVEIGLTELTDAERVQYLKKNSRLPQLIQAVIVSDDCVDEMKIEDWQLVKGMILERQKSSNAQFDCDIFMMAKKRKTDPSLRLLAPVFSDVFYYPVERSHFLKKAFLFFPRAQVQSPIEIKQYEKNETIAVGNPIKVTELSEAGMVIDYYRGITVGSFRRFVLWFPIEIGQPDILGACNFNKSNEGDPPVFENHFVFFGMQDDLLKHVRLWIRDNYIHSKQE